MKGPNHGLDPTVRIDPRSGASVRKLLVGGVVYLLALVAILTAVTHPALTAGIAVGVAAAVTAAGRLCRHLRRRRRTGNARRLCLSAAGPCIEL